MALPDPRVVQCTDVQGPNCAVMGTRAIRELEVRLRHSQNPKGKNSAPTTAAAAAMAWVQERDRQQQKKRRGKSWQQQRCRHGHIPQIQFQR